MSEPTPMQICQAAMVAMGAPKDYVLTLKPGRYTDALTHFFVMQKKPWSESVSLAMDYVESEKEK